MVQLIQTLTFLLFIIQVGAQVVIEPCTNGRQPSCRCSTAPVLCTIDDLNGSVLRMSNYQHAENARNPLCPGSNGVPNNPNWLAFVAWCESIDLRFVLRNCTARRFNLTWSNGVQIAVYSSCGPPNSAYNAVGCLVDSDVMCCSGLNCNVPNNHVLALTGLNIGETYYLVVDGCGGAHCDVEIQVLGTCGNEVLEDWPEPIDGPDVVCLEENELYIFSATHPNTGLIYSWYVDGNLMQRDTKPQIEIEFLVAGEVQICVDISKPPCVQENAEPGPLCKTVSVHSTFVENPPPIAICEGDSILYHGTYYQAGEYLVPLVSQQGCDSTITLIVEELAAHTQDLGVINICRGQVYQMSGMDFTESGRYEVLLQKNEYPYCDSLVVFNLEVLSLDSISDIELSCKEPMKVIEPRVTSSSLHTIYAWYDFRDSLVNEGPNYLANEVGLYYLVVRDTVANCEVMSNTFEVILIDDRPELYWDAPDGLTLNCAVSELRLISQELEGIVYRWKKDDQIIETPQYILNSPGTIWLVGISEITGCADSVLISINEDFYFPQVNLIGNAELTCAFDRTQISLEIQNHNRSSNIRWLNSMGDIISMDSTRVEVADGGWIWVRVQDVSSSCISEDSVWIEDLRLYPQIVNLSWNDLDCTIDSTIISYELRPQWDHIYVRWYLDGQRQGEIFLPNEFPKVGNGGLVRIEAIDTTNQCVGSVEFELLSYRDKPGFAGMALNDALCEGDLGFLLLDNNSYSAEQYPLSWKIEGQLYNVLDTAFLAPGSYLVELTNRYGCKSDTLVFINDGSILIVSLPDTLYLDLGDTITLNPSVRSSQVITKILWSPEIDIGCTLCRQTEVFPLISRLYTVEIEDTIGCTSTASVWIEVQNNFNVFIPDAFTPNLDGINDKLTVFTDKRVEQIDRMEIYDRWGSLVFAGSNLQPNDPNQGWDGTLRGLPAQAGQYTYWIRLRLIGGKEEIIRGGFTLIK